MDAAIITGALHALGPGALAAESDLYPAIDDPKFAGSGLDPGYLTSKPGTREALFYYPLTADPAVVAEDEATKDLVTAAQFGQGLGQFGIPPDQALSQQVTVPVLLVVGQQDGLFCVGTSNCTSAQQVTAMEAPFYPPQAHLQSLVMPDTGHDLALSTTAPLTDAGMLAWSLSVVRP